MLETNLTLGQYLERARRDAGLTTRQLAALAHIHGTVIMRLLKDRVSAPRPEHLMALAAVLEVPTRALFDLVGIAMPIESRSVAALLRAEYDLPPEAIREANAQVASIVARYGKGSENQSHRVEENHG